MRTIHLGLVAASINSLQVFQADNPNQEPRHLFHAFKKWFSLARGTGTTTGRKAYSQNSKPIPGILSLLLFGDTGIKKKKDF
jgi:hypothetical protein